MEIDIFPLPSSKGVHRYIGTAFLGLIIITYIVGAYMVAQQLIGEGKELLSLLVAIPIFNRWLCCPYIVAPRYQAMSLCLLQTQ